jgi:cell wall-associated NlpC family hydrolase
VRNIGLASLLTILWIPIPSLADADDSITLQLPAFTGEDSQQRSDVAQQNPAPKPKMNPAANVPTANRHMASFRGESVVGRLGVSNRSAQIKSSRSSKGRTLASVPAGTYLALSREASDYYGVLMSNRSIGWMKKQDVNVLDYEVVAPETQMTRTQNMLASRSGATLMGSGQQALLQEAYKHLGVPYKYGGTSTSNGIDCSSFVQQCFATVGIGLPRTAHEQFNVGTPVAAEELQPADRVYFAGRSGNISHTGIYIGNGFFIHASSSNHGVAVSRLTDPMYTKMYAGARRL